MNDEIRWKEQLHAQWMTPDAIIDDLVHSASGSVVHARSRIVGGEGNEVWSISTRAGDDLIVRVSHRTTFAAEQWATEQARGVGVPVPEILLVDDRVSVGDTRLAVWIHRKIQGQALDTLQDKQTLRRLTADAGELLARIHAVHTNERGPIGAQGRGLLRSFSEVLRWDDRAADAALVNGVSGAEIDQATRLLEAHEYLWAAPPRLLHGDWLSEHVLVRDDSVVGIIDFGNTRTGDPAYDIAYWQFFWDTDGYPLSCLLDGYRRAGDLDHLIDRRMHLCRLGLSMRALAYYTEHARDFPAQHAARRFSESLAWLRANAT
jgi:aminoglycoside phosphotransferase (APT) family kinase protein